MNGPRSLLTLPALGAAFTAGLLGCSAALAQDALDRSDPNQEDLAGFEDQFKPASTHIAIVPVALDDGVYDSRIYKVRSILIDGLTELNLADFGDIIEQYSARSLTADDLSTLSNLMAARAQERGYIFASARIDPQSLEYGTLRVRVAEGTIDEIRIEGADDAAIASVLEPLKNGSPVTLEMLERRILLADDIPGVWIRRTRFRQVGARGILIVEATREDFGGKIEIAREGSSIIGPERARIALDAHGLLKSSDSVDLTFSTTPLDLNELLYVSGRYSVAIGNQGMRVTAFGSYSATRPGSFLADRNIYGEATRFGLQLRYPVVRNRNFSLWVDGSLEHRDLTQDRAEILARHDRISVARLGMYSLAKLGGGRLRARATLSQGLDILGATQRGDPLASRSDAPAMFTTLAGWAEWERDLSGDFSIALAGKGQISSAPLLIAEDIGLGGGSFLRGYNFSARSGDEGVMGSGELRYDWANPFGLISNAQLYAFADGGDVWNLDGGFGGGSLASSGGGIRAAITRDLGLDVEVAFPLTGPRYDTNDKAPRVNVAVEHSF